MRPIEIGRWQHVQRLLVGIVIAYKYTARQLGDGRGVGRR